MSFVTSAAGNRHRVRWVQFIAYRTYADLLVEADRYYIGYLWWITEPLIEMMVYYVVFAKILGRQTDEFALFLLCGVLSWRWFQTTINAGSASIARNKTLATQVFVPKVVFPIVAVASQTVRFVFTLVLFTLLVVALEGVACPQYGALIVVFLVQLGFHVGCVLLVAGLVPLFPSFEILISTVMRLLFFLSGIFFAADRIPAEWRQWLDLNPMFVILRSWRAVLLYRGAPDWGLLALIVVASGAAAAAGVAVIKHFEREYSRVYG